VIGLPSDDADLVFEVTRFLSWEAALLDDCRFHDWLELLTDDVRYRIRCGPPVAEGSAEPGLWYLDEDAASLRQRIERMDDGTAWAEVPPSRCQRLVTGVLVEPGEDQRVDVRSSLLLHRTRLERETEIFTGSRLDTLVQTGGGFRLADRSVTLAANALPGKNLSVLL
jgi:3-phenylpropionate/cinnamic acid dioxygenase small subunit